MSASTIRCDGQTCTCGIGPWDLRGQCAECGGFDLGKAWLDPSTMITLQQDGDRIRAWLPKGDER